MKSIVLVIFTLMSALNGYAQQPPGHITIKGRQFYDGYGNPFYPILMTYTLEYQFPNGNPGPHWMNRSWEYGTNHNAFENDNLLDAQQEIMDDLDVIASWGFNMVRPDFTPEWDDDDQQFYLKGREYGVLNDPYDPFNHSPGHRTWFTEPFETDANVEKYFENLEWFIDQAGARGIYTMITGALGDVSDPNATISYSNFLQLLGDRFKDNTFLAFYDILNEPVFKYTHAQDFYNTKMQACELVAHYYDQLRMADPHHLISGGNRTTEDILLFDLSLMKLDFGQPHLYSDGMVAYDGYNVTNKINRIKNSSYWIQQNCPMPWMVGETGFPSTDEYPIPTDKVAADGTNADQQTYVEEVLAAIRDYGGSGISWWNYQEGSWVEYGVLLDGYGLLTLEADIHNLQYGEEKPAIQTFQNYLDVNGQPPAPASPTPGQPPNYLDPYLNGNYNTYHTGKVTGTLIDQDNNPIPNAWILGRSYQYFDFNENRNVYTWIHTYTSQDGIFEIIPYNDHIDGNGIHMIPEILGSAAGVQSFKANSGHSQLPNPGTIVLERIKFEYDAQITNETVVVNDEKNFKGWNSITVSHTTIEGESEISARDEVRLMDGFHATGTSDVHVFNAETFAVCSDYANFQTIQARQMLIGSTSNEDPASEIELFFSKPTTPIPAIRIFPNPASSYTTISLSRNYSKSPSTLLIKNIYNATLRKVNITENEVLIHLNGFSKGIYFIEVHSSEHILTQKLIIQ